MREPTFFRAAGVWLVLTAGVVLLGVVLAVVS